MQINADEVRAMVREETLKAHPDAASNMEALDTAIDHILPVLLVAMHAIGALMEMAAIVGVPSDEVATVSVHKPESVQVVGGKVVAAVRALTRRGDA